MKKYIVVVLVFAITLLLTFTMSSESISQEIVTVRSREAQGYPTEKARYDALYYEAGDIYYAARLKCMYQGNEMRRQCQNAAKAAYDVTTRRAVEFYKAEAVYYTSKIKCRSLTGVDKEVCQMTAKDSYDTAMKNTDTQVGSIR